MKDRTPLSLSLSRVSVSLTFHLSLDSHHPCSPAFSSISNVLALPICSISISLLLHVTHDFGVSQPLKPASPCINFPRRFRFSPSRFSFPSLSLYWSPNGCSWFNLRLDLTSGPHAVHSPFSAIWPLLVRLVSRCYEMCGSGYFFKSPLF